MLFSVVTPLNVAKYRVLHGLEAIFPWMARFRYHERVAWWSDRAWIEPYRKYLSGDGVAGRPATRILDRRFFLIQMAHSVSDLAGSTAECGVFHGVGSALVCQTLRETYSPDCGHFAFDSFEGLPEPEESDRMANGRHHWYKGKLRTQIEEVEAFLADFPFCRVVKGWIPQSLTPAAEHRFRLVHVDVDLRQPTWDSLEFFYSRMVKGGVFVLDDHGFIDCPGARIAAREFFAGKPEKIVEVPTGQAFVVKQ